MSIDHHLHLPSDPIDGFLAWLKEAVALVFHWTTISKQLRVEGVCEKLTREESEIYFQSRARGSRIGAWASPQSHEIPSREFLENRVKEIEEKFAGVEIPCPPFWGGWRVMPKRIEFWHGGESRLHDRQVFEWTESNWQSMRLAP